MKLLKEILRRPGMSTVGKTLQREAVRGIILGENRLLMIYSTREGDYKFPGGGVEPGESHAQTLAREIREECGASVAEIGPAFGKVIEYDRPLEREYQVFKMTSFYYLCQVGTIFQEQQLEQYEADLGFQPVWIELETAIRINQSILASASNPAQRWVERETFVLEQIKEQLFLF